MPGDPDAVVVGSGPNGLAAAVTLSAAGLRVLVIEGGPTIGGGCRTEELTLPGFRHDVCSAAHPLAVASPFFRRFDLAARGVRFARSDVVFAQPLDGGRAAVVTRSVAATAARLGRGRAPPTSACSARWPATARAVTDLVLTPIRRPPSRLPAGLAVFAANGLRSAAGVARRFRTPEGRALFAGVAAHGDDPAGRAADRRGRHDADRAWPTGPAGRCRRRQRPDHRRAWPAVAGRGRGHRDGPLGTLARRAAPARAVLLDVAPRALLAIAGDRLPGATRTRCAGSVTAPGCARPTSPCPARCRGRTRRAAGPARCTSAARSRRSRRPRS